MTKSWNLRGKPSLSTVLNWYQHLQDAIQMLNAVTQVTLKRARLWLKELEPPRAMAQPH